MCSIPEWAPACRLHYDIAGAADRFRALQQGAAGSKPGGAACRLDTCLPTLRRPPLPAPAEPVAVDIDTELDM